MKYAIELEVAELQIVANALASMPYGQVVQLIAKIQTQVSAQDETAKQNS